MAEQVPLATKSSLFVGASATLVASVGGLALGVVTNILLARTLGPEFKGRLDLIAASSGLAVVAFGFSLASGLTYVVARYDPDLRVLLGQLALITLGQGIAVGVAGMAVAASAYHVAFIPTDYVAWGAYAIAAWTAGWLWVGYMRAIVAGLQKFVLAALADAAQKVLLLSGVGSILIVGWPSSPEGIAVATIWLNVGVVLVMGGLLIVAVWPDIRANKSPIGLREVWRYAWPSYGANLAQFANYRLDVFLVAYFAGVREVALYGVAASLAQLLWLPSNAMQSVLFPRLARLAEPSAKGEEAAFVSRILFSLTMIAGIGISLGANGLIAILVGSAYADSLVPLWLLLPGVVVFSLANVLAGYLAAIGKPQRNFQISLASLGVTLAADVLLIPTYGMRGAAVASTLSYTLAGVLALVFFQREARISLKRAIRVEAHDLAVLWEMARPWLAEGLKKLRR